MQSLRSGDEVALTRDLIDHDQDINDALAPGWPSPLRKGVNAGVPSTTCIRQLCALGPWRFELA